MDAQAIVYFTTWAIVYDKTGNIERAASSAKLAAEALLQTPNCIFAEHTNTYKKMIEKYGSKP